MRTEDIAAVCHEANRTLQLVLNEANPSRTWATTPEETRLSAIEGVEKAIAGATPEELHQSWCEFKYSHGWRHGEHKNDETREHPCLVPYDELPPDQRAKDALFHAIVHALS